MVNPQVHFHIIPAPLPFAKPDTFAPSHMELLTLERERRVELDDEDGIELVRRIQSKL